MTDTTSQQDDLRCNNVIDHVEKCKLCHTYLRSEIKFQYFVIIILSTIIIYYIVRDHEIK